MLARKVSALLGHMSTLDQMSFDKCSATSMSMSTPTSVATRASDAQLIDFPDRRAGRNGEKLNTTLGWPYHLTPKQSKTTAKSKTERLKPKTKNHQNALHFEVAKCAGMATTYGNNPLKSHLGWLIRLSEIGCILFEKVENIHQCHIN